MKSFTSIGTSMGRRQLLLAGAASFVAAPRRLSAQPADTLRIVNGYPPGGSIDIVSRKLAEKLAGRAARNVLVENKPGAAGRLAIDEVRRALPGSAMLVTPASTMTMYPHVYRRLSYDPFTDLVPVSAVATSGFALAVGPKVDASVATIHDLVTWCRANPAGATCGHAGSGSMPHFMVLIAAREMRVPLTPVPYRGGLASVQGTAAGETAMALATESSVRALQQAGKVRALATTWDRRSPFLPAVPTFRESGITMSQREWFGAFVPARTPEAQVRELSELLRTVLGESDVQDAWERSSLTADAGGPAALREALRAEHDFWGPVVRASGFTPES